MTTPSIEKTLSSIDPNKQVVRFNLPLKHHAIGRVSTCVQNYFISNEENLHNGVPKSVQNRWFSPVQANTSVTADAEIHEITGAEEFEKKHKRLNKDHANLRMQLIYLIFRVVHQKGAFFRLQETTLQYGVPRTSDDFVGKFGKLEACHPCAFFLGDNARLMDRIDELIKSIEKSEYQLTKKNQRILLECDVPQEEIDSFDLWLTFQSGDLECLLNKCMQSKKAKTDVEVKRTLQMYLKMLFRDAKTEDKTVVLEKGSCFQLITQIFELNLEEISKLRNTELKNAFLGKKSNIFDVIFGTKIEAFRKHPQTIRNLANFISQRQFSDENELFVETILDILEMDETKVAFICDQWKNREKTRAHLTGTVREKLHQLPTVAGTVKPGTRLYELLGSTTFLLAEVNQYVDHVFDRERGDLMPTVNQVSFGQLTPEEALDKVAHQIIRAYEREIKRWEHEIKTLGLRVCLQQEILKKDLNYDVVVDYLMQLMKLGDDEIVKDLLEPLFYNSSRVQLEKFWTAGERINKKVGFARILMIALKRQFSEKEFLKLEEKDLLQKDQKELQPVLEQLLEKYDLKARLLALVKMDPRKYLDSSKKVLRQSAVPETLEKADLETQACARKIQYAQEQIEGMTIDAEEVKKNLVHQDPPEIQRYLLEQIPVVYFTGKF